MEFFFGRKPQKLRILPLVAPLTKMITKRRDYLCNQGASELDDLYMVYGHTEEVLTNRKRVKRIKTACETMIQKANIQKILLRLPDKNGERLTDINSFIGDLLQHNYRYQANHVMKMNRGETQYLLGLAPPDTFYRHYCDMTNSFIQLSMSIKMARWTATHKVFAHSVKQVLQKITPTLIKKTASRYAEACGNQVATLDLIVDSKEDVEFDLSIETDRGANAMLTMLRKELPC